MEITIQACFNNSISKHDWTHQMTIIKFPENLDWCDWDSQAWKSILIFYSKRKHKYSSTFCMNLRALLHLRILKWGYWILRLNLRLLFISFLTFLDSSKIFVFRSLYRKLPLIMLKRISLMKFWSRRKISIEVAIFWSKRKTKRLKNIDS